MQFLKHSSLDRGTGNIGSDTSKMAHALEPHGPEPYGPVPPVPVPHRQFIVRLNKREYVLLREALTDGFIIVWLGDSHARNISQRNHRSPVHSNEHIYISYRTKATTLCY